MIARLLLLGVIALSSAGCLVASVHPLFEEATLVKNEQLIGTWRNAEQNLSLAFTHGAWQAYNLTYEDAFGAQTFIAYLTTIGDNQFLDVTLPGGVDRGPYLLALHGFYRAAVNGSSLTLTPLNYDWFESAASKRQTGTLRGGVELKGIGAIIDSRKHVLLTSETETLRQWFARQPDKSEVWGVDTVFARVDKP